MPVAAAAARGQSRFGSVDAHTVAAAGDVEEGWGSEEVGGCVSAATGVTSVPPVAAPCRGMPLVLPPRREAGAGERFTEVVAVAGAGEDEGTDPDRALVRVGLPRLAMRRDRTGSA